ncbi:MAG: DegT/DnrJ/EryC1/StrS family aminotransferase [Acidobacteria bacterium]|nr:DegT/DnrJ/EryC1/StrS family aminotransferase [Acidobacteriota bacterium]
MAYTVPFVNPREHYRRYQAELEAAMIGALAQGDLIMRGQLREFEQNLARFVGCRHVVGVASGYHALHLSLLAAGVGPGDEVVTVAHTFVATISAIVNCGASPVLVDVRDDYDMDCGALEAAITPRTRAVLPVHLNGRVSDMAAIGDICSRRGLLIIEDAAQAIGATFGGRQAGTFGRAGCFSFFPFKILGGFGDGGAVATDDEAIALAIRRLRYNGEDRDTGEYHYHGFSALLDNVQAAVLDVKLRHLPSWIEHRRRIAQRYTAALAGVGDLRLPPADDADRRDIFQNYVIRTSRRDALRAHLRSSGIETLVHWPKPVWEHLGLRLGEHRLPNTEAICREVISLPMSAETTDRDVELAAAAIRGFFGD